MRYPVSIKGFIVKIGRFLLVKNDRNEWELPGGQIETGESQEQCLKREIREELQIDVTLLKIIGTQLFEVIPGRYVFLAVYLCEMPDENALIELSHEHTKVEWFNPAELPRKELPEVYREFIETARSVV
jgi:mutator protein MutT